MGCVSQRRKTLLDHEDADFYIWLDTDIIFDEKTLLYMENAMQSVQKFTPYTFITPEIVKIWDDSWDCLVNEEFLDKPAGYQQTNDPYKDSGVSSTCAFGAAYAIIDIRKNISTTKTSFFILNPPLYIIIYRLLYWYSITNI